MLNLMIALFYRVMPKKMIHRIEGFSTQDFMAAMHHIPDSVLPERRKQRAYLSSILSKNEISKDDKYNRKLFYRVLRGAYIFNPRLALKVNDEWINIYDLLTIDRLAPPYQVKQDWWNNDHNLPVEWKMAVCKDLLKRLIAEKRLPTLDGTSKKT